MNLLYNVDYEMAGTIILLIIFVYMNVMYPKNRDSIIRYARTFIILIIANVLDILTAIDITYAYAVPALANIAVNTLYFFSIILLQYAYFDYILSFLNYEVGKTVRIVNKAVITGYSLALFINVFTGIIFSFDEKGVYCHGPIYLIVYLTVLYYVIAGYVVMYKNRNNLRFRVVASIGCFTVLQIIGCIIQIFVFPNVLITCFTASLAMIVLLLVLETPDYAKLVNTLEELEASKAELELANHVAMEAKREAEDASKAKSAFLAQMSHEIRTPINGVLGMNSVIMKETREEKILEYSKNIDNAGNSLLSIINDILDLSKIETGKMELVPVKYDLSNVLSACYNLEFLRAQEKGLDFLFENNTTIPCDLYGDEVRIRQIIVNLLTNAIKYTKEGIVQLTADWEEIDESNMTLIISVKDTGMGIPKENLDKIFEAFERVDQEKNKNIEGTGLGLRITKQLLDLMNGTIEVESDYGIGSEFTVRIPQRIVGKKILGDFANYVHISSSSAEDSFQGFKCPQGKILVVDDVELNTKVIAGLLKESELQIDMAFSGKECLEKIKDNTYDVILLDHMMPNMDGIETLDRMKKMGDVFNINTPVIALTANAISGAKEEYIEAGFTDYLSKPVREQELNEMMIKYLPTQLVMLSEVSIGIGRTEEEIAQDRAGIEAMDAFSDRIEIRTPDNKVGIARKYYFIDADAGMNYCLNNEEFYESIIDEYRDSNKYDEIQDSFDDLDFANYAILVHGVKSASLTIGATVVSNMAKELELAAKVSDTDFIKKNHYKFMRAYGELLDNLDEVHRQQ